MKEKYNKAATQARELLENCEKEGFDLYKDLRVHLVGLLAASIMANGIGCVGERHAFFLVVDAITDKREKIFGEMVDDLIFYE